MPHPPRSEAQGLPPPQHFNEPRPPRSEAQRPPQHFNEPRPPRSEAQGIPPQRLNEPRPPRSEAQGPPHQQPPFGEPRAAAVSPHQPCPPQAPGPSEVFFQQKQQPPPSHTPPQVPPQVQPRFQGPPPPGKRAFFQDLILAVILVICI